MNIRSFISKSTGLNKADLEKILLMNIQEIKETVSPKEFENEVDNYISNFISKTTDFLVENKKTSLFTEFMQVTLNTVSRFEIKNLSVPLNIISDMVELVHNTNSPGKKTRVKRDKRKDIFDAAMIVFSQKGFHHAHVDEIAEYAGIAKGTIYRYFKSKDEILKELVLEKNSIIVNELKNIFDKDDDILELIKEAIVHHVDFCERNKDLYRILIHTPWISNDINTHFYKNIISHLPMIKRRIISLSLKGKIKTSVKA